MPLKLSLKPRETFIVNGAVVQNGDRRGVLLLQNRARILREKDVIQPEDVRSDADRLYLALMLYYLAGDHADAEFERYRDALANFVAAETNPDRVATAKTISALVAAGQLYKSLVACRKLVSTAPDGATP